MTTFQKIIKYLAIAFAVFLSISIISGICGAIFSITGIFHNNPVGEMKQYSVGSEFTEMKTELSAASLEIKTGDQFRIDSNHKYIDCREEDGCLVIKEKKSTFPGRFADVRVVVTIPEGTVFQTAQIGAGAGEVDIEELAADSLTLELAAGELNAGKLTAAKQARIDGGAGSVSIKEGSLHNADIDMGVGELEYTGTLTGRARIDYGVGETNLVLTGSEKDYEISLDKGVGEATLNGRKMSDDAVYGSGNNRIEIDGGVGELEITFR